MSDTSKLFITYGSNLVSNDSEIYIHLCQP